VTQEELLEHVWPEVTVQPIAMTRNISAIRMAVGDSGTPQQVIRGIVNLFAIGAAKQASHPGGEHRQHR
jgi:hypothetical protein